MAPAKPITSNNPSPSISPTLTWSLALLAIESFELKLIAPVVDVLIKMSMPDPEDEIKSIFPSPFMSPETIEFEVPDVVKETAAEKLEEFITDPAVNKFLCTFSEPLPIFTTSTIPFPSKSAARTDMSCELLL